MIFKALTLIGFCSAVLVGAGALDGTRFSLAADGPTTRPHEKNNEKKAPHPEIRTALMDLRQAKNRLEAAAHDVGGHLAVALKSTQDAIQQCELALHAESN